MYRLNEEKIVKINNEKKEEKMFMQNKSDLSNGKSKIKWKKY